MEIFPNESFEIELFKTGKSGKKYDLSYNGLKIIHKNDLVDLLTNDIFGFKEKIISRYSRILLLKILNKELLKLHKPENIELFGLKDPRKKELTEKEKEYYNEKKFPKTIITSLTHGTYSIPSTIRKEVKQEISSILSKKLLPDNKNINKIILEEYQKFIRILKHYSDFGTRYLVNHSFIPKSQIIKAEYSRGIKDPARELSTKIRETDFSGNKLPSSLEKGTEIGELGHLIYHLKILDKLNKTLNLEGGYILIDDHDTGVLKISKNKELDKYNTGGFPLITLGTKDGESCNPEIVKYYAKRIEYHLGIKPLINEPYKGGYVTQKYGTEKRKELSYKKENQGIANVIQQEISKFLYLDEKTQIVDKDKAEWIGIGLARAKSDLGRKFGKEYFKAVKKGNKAVEKYLENYKDNN